MKLVPIPSRDNPFFPLPADYLSLTVEGQRQARVNACRQWLIKEEWYEGDSDSRRLSKMFAYLRAYEFFDLYYLHPDSETNFDPQFYDDTPLPMPEMHRDIIRLRAVGRLNVITCPRGSGKSRTLAKDILLNAITRPANSDIYATSSHDNAKGMGQILRNQAYYNERIQDDFGPEYDVVTLRPPKGEAPTGVENFHLTNGSWIRCISAESKQRGGRPRRYRLDDPEYDAKASTEMTVRRQYMETLLFKVILPMVTRGGDIGVDWPNTFVSKRHYAWKAQLVGPDGRAEDARFDYWNRLIIDAIIEPTPENKLAKPVSCWPEMWPYNIAEKKEKAKTDPSYEKKMSLEEMESLMGTAFFNNEMRAKPGEGDGMYWPDIWAPDVRALYNWEWSDPSGAHPRVSNVPITWNRKRKDGTLEAVSLPMREFLSRCRVFATVDTSYTSKATSDHKACSILAYLPTHNELFVLDLFSKVCGEAELINETFRLCDYWKAQSINIEVVKDSKDLYETFRHHIQVRAFEALDIKHCPSVKPYRVGTDSKGQRISGALDLRFQHFLIRFPLRHRHRKPWSYLFSQIEGFNPEMENLGLEHDDAIDTVAMSLYVLKGRRDPSVYNQQPTESVLDLVKRGVYTDPQGNNFAIGIPWDHIDPAIIAEVLDSSGTRARLAQEAIRSGTTIPYQGSKA